MNYEKPDRVKIPDFSNKSIYTYQIDGGGNHANRYYQLIIVMLDGSNKPIVSLFIQQVSHQTILSRRSIVDFRKICQNKF